MGTPYDRFAKDMLAEQTYGSIYSNQYADANKSARANETARRLGIAPELVEAAMPDMLAEERLRKRIAETQRNTPYARVMANPRLAAAAIDDDHLPDVAKRADELRRNPYRGLPHFGQAFLVKGAVNFFGGLVDTLGTGVAGFAQQAGDQLGLGSTGPGVGVVSPTLRLFASGAGVVGRGVVGPLERLSERLSPRGYTRNQDDVLAGFRSTGGTVGALGVTVLTRNPWAGAGLMGVATSGQSYREGLAEGLDSDTASQYAVTQGGIETVTEYLGQRILGNAVKGAGKGMLKAVGLDIAAELPGEAAATVGQELSRWYYIERPNGKSFEEYLAEIPDELRSTVVSTVVTGGLAGTGGYTAARYIERKIDERTAGQVDRIMESAAKSPTRAANPSDFEEALNQLVGDSDAENLYVPAEKVRELFQDDERLSEDPFWGDYSEQVEEAEALGGDVVLPLAKVATHLAGSPQWQQLRDHVRTRPGGSSIAEAKSRETPEELERLAAEVARQVEEAVPRMQLSQAQTAIGKWAEGMGYSGEQAQTVNRYLAAAASRAYDADRQRRARFNREAVSMGDFIKEWLPKAQKGKQAQFEGQELERKAAKAARSPTPAKSTAVDVIEFVRKLGGIKDRLPHERGGTSTPHDLAKGRGFAKRPGLINNKSGKTIDELGEALWEAGYFSQAERPTTTDVLELLDRGFFQKVYRPVDTEDVQVQEQSEQGDDQEAEIEAEVREYLAANKMNLTPSELSLAVSYRGDGLSLEDAIERAFEDVADQLFNQLFDEPVQPSRSMTQAQRAELEAGQKQQMARRGGQQSVKDQEGGLFSSERDQDTLFQLKRGNISIQADNDGLMRTALIRAFEASNFSTAVHELGHFFLEDLRRRASRPDALGQEQVDWQAFKDWATELGHPVPDIGPIPVEAHEYFARGMERYVWEGNAPSSVLRSLFYKMREFMLDLYRTATAFNAPITSEIREVMDRMLASDAEIERRRSEMKLVSNAVGELLTEAEQADYARIAEENGQDARTKLYERVLSTLRRERSEETRERKAEITAEVTTQIEQMPVFQALKLLRTGIDGAKVKLSRQWLIDAYGQEVIGKLPKGVPPIVSDTDTMDPDQIADMVGFPSGDAMVTALIAHEAQRANLKASGDKRSPRAQLIGDAVDERVRDEIGDPFENLEEEAEAALISERQADLMSMELRALGRKSGKRPTAWKMATEWASNHVRQQTSREAISGKSLQMYSRNAAKAGQEAEEALIKNDFATAFAAKQRQLLNMALTQEAKRAKDETDKAVRRLQKIAGRATIPSIDQEYLDQAHQLLEDVDMKTRPASRDDKRLRYEAWHQQQVVLGIEPTVPAEYRSILGKTNWAKLPIEELLELDRAVGQIIELGRLKKRLKDGKEERDFDDAVAEMEAKAEEQAGRPQTAENDPNRTMGGRVKSRLRGVNAAMIKVEQMCDWLDGGDPNGPWNRMIFQRAAEAQGRENDLMRSYIEQINGLIKGLPKERVRSWDRKVSTPELRWNVRGHPMNGQPIEFRMDQIVMMAMNWGNEGNRQRLVDGFGWEEADVLAVFDRLLAKEDWDFVQSVWDTVDGMWPEIEALERRVNGVAPEKVIATEVQTPHGVYRGGYFPAVYDPTYSTRVELDEASKLSPQGAWHQVTTRASSTKERALAVKGRPLLLNMSVITRHLGEVIHDVTHREAVGQIRKLLAEPRIRSAVDSRLGREYLKRMESWVENIATPNAANSKTDPTLTALARHLSKGVSLVGLGFRLSTVIIQPLGMANMTAEIGEKAMANGLRIATASPRATYNEIVSRSAEMRSRFSTMDANIDDMARDAGAGKLRSIGPRGITKYAFHGILYMDMLITTAGWIGAYNQGLEKGMNEDEAQQWADKVIRKTQGAGGQKDRSAIMYANEFARTFYPFFSYLNALYNQQSDILRRTRNTDSAAGGADTMRRAWWVVVVPALVQALLFGEGPEEDEDGPETWAEYLTKSVILGNLASVPGIGPIANAIGAGYGYRSNAWQGIGEGVKKAWDDADKVTEDDGELKGSTIKTVLTTVGVLSAKPLGQIGATSQGIYDYARGEAEPEDAGDWYELLTKGRVSKEPTAMEQLMGEEA